MQKIWDDFKTTISLTTHYLDETDQLSDTICIMKEGHELVQETPGNLKQYIRQNILRIGFSEKKKAEECADILAKEHILTSINVRECSNFADAGDDRKIFEVNWVWGRGK